MNCDVRVAVHVVEILNSLMSLSGHHRFVTKMLRLARLDQERETMYHTAFFRQELPIPLSIVFFL